MSSLLLTTAWFSFSLQIFPILSDTPDPNCFLSPLILLSQLLLQTASNHCPHFLPWLLILIHLSPNCCLKSLLILHSTAAIIPSSFFMPIAAWSLCPLLPQLLSDPFVLSYPNCCLIPLSFLTPTAAWSLCPLLSHLLSNNHVLIPTSFYSSGPYLSQLLPNPRSPTSPLPPNAPIPCFLTSPLLPYPLFSYITTAAQYPCLLSSQLLPIPLVLYPLILLYPSCCLKFPYPSISLLLLNPLILFIPTAALSLALSNPNCLLFPCPHLSNCFLTR